MNVYSIRLYTVLSLLSDLGGFFTALFTILALIGVPINRWYLVSKIARAVYIGKNRHGDEE